MKLNRIITLILALMSSSFYIVLVEANQVHVKVLFVAFEAAGGNQHVKTTMNDNQIYESLNNKNVFDFTQSGHHLDNIYKKVASSEFVKNKRDADGGPNKKAKTGDTPNPESSDFVFLSESPTGTLPESIGHSGKNYHKCKSWEAGESRQRSNYMGFYQKVNNPNDPNIYQFHVASLKRGKKQYMLGVKKAASVEGRNICIVGVHLDSKYISATAEFPENLQNEIKELMGHNQLAGCTNFLVLGDFNMDAEKQSFVKLDDSKFHCKGHGVARSNSVGDKSYMGAVLCVSDTSILQNFGLYHGERFFQEGDKNIFWTDHHPIYVEVKVYQ